MNNSICVIPAAGKGTRVGTITNGRSKEMLSFRGKPLIRNAIEEAAFAGYSRIIVISHRNKTDLNNYIMELCNSATFLDLLASLNKDLPETPRSINILYQTHQNGLGNAVETSKNLIPPYSLFGVLLPDEVYEGAPMLQLRMLNRACIGVVKVQDKDRQKYGIADINLDYGKIVKIVEKPTPEEASSNWAVVGRYVLPDSILPILTSLAVGKNGEYQLTDALNKYSRLYTLNAIPILDTRFDKGSVD